MEFSRSFDLTNGLVKEFGKILKFGLVLQQTFKIK